MPVVNPPGHDQPGAFPAAFAETDGVRHVVGDIAGPVPECAGRGVAPAGGVPRLDPDDGGDEGCLFGVVADSGLHLATTALSRRLSRGALARIFASLMAVDRFFKSLDGIARCTSP